MGRHSRGGASTPPPEPEPPAPRAPRYAPRSPEDTGVWDHSTYRVVDVGLPAEAPAAFPLGGTPPPAAPTRGRRRAGATRADLTTPPSRAGAPAPRPPADPYAPAAQAVRPLGDRDRYATPDRYTTPADRYADPADRHPGRRPLGPSDTGSGLHPLGPSDTGSGLRPLGDRDAAFGRADTGSGLRPFGSSDTGSGLRPLGDRDGGIGRADTGSGLRPLGDRDGGFGRADTGSGLRPLGDTGSGLRPLGERADTGSGLRALGERYGDGSLRPLDPYGTGVHPLPDSRSTVDVHPLGSGVDGGRSRYGATRADLVGADTDGATALKTSAPPEPDEVTDTGARRTRSTFHLAEDPDDEPEDESSLLVQWAVFVAQTLTGAAVGLGVWLGFYRLWSTWPLYAAPGVGVAAIVLLVTARALRRRHGRDLDLLTAIVTFGVTTVLTVLPAAFALQSLA